MKRVFYILLTAVVMCAMLPSCGSSSGDEPDNPDIPIIDPSDITRPQDGEGKVFLENGRMVDATTKFTTADIKAALAATSWTCSYIFKYDNDSISDILTSDSDYYLLATLLTTDNTAIVTGQLKSSYSVRGKTIIISPPTYSSISSNTVYTVVAVDYTDTLKRLIIDHSKTDDDNLRYRMVWVPQDTTDAQ